MRHLKLMILMADPESAKQAQEAGVDRVFYDLEYIGKESRQHGRNTVKSMNSIDDIPAVRKVLDNTELLVRTNPIHAYTKMEVDKAIEYGADVLMLPMVMDQHDVEQYVSYVNIGEGDLPSDYILGEHVRLGSQSVILSRTFKGVVGVDKNARPIDLKEEVMKVRDRLEEIKEWTGPEYAENRAYINDAVEKVIYKILTR